MSILVTWVAATEGSMSAVSAVGRIHTLFWASGPLIRWFRQDAGHRFFMRKLFISSCRILNSLVNTLWSIA